MDEHQVRLMVRQAIARHIGAPETPAVAPRPAAPSAAPALTPNDTHAAFARFHLVRPAGETDCLIEPTVTCNHCGHCQCFGH